MALMAMYSAATGLEALSTKLDVIANNMANVNTVGFKRVRANFEDLMYQTRRQPGVENGEGNTSPAGMQLGLGVRFSNTQTNYAEGAAMQTDKELDLMVQGPGFFKVSVYDTLSPDGVAYTRAGNFFLNRDNEIVLGNYDGFRMEPVITLPDATNKIAISTDGIVSAYVNGSDQPQQVGQIELVRFANNEGLERLGQNLFATTAASGPPIEGNPTDEGFGSVRQGVLEASNVESVTELVDMIQTQRSFELNSQAIQTADQMLQVSNNLSR